MSGLNESTTETFEKDVLESEKTVLVDFFADWCGPCKTMLPILDELSKDAELSNASVVKINVDNSPELAQKYGVRGIPTMLFFKGGKVVKTYVGVQSKEELKKIFKEIN